MSLLLCTLTFEAAPLLVQCRGRGGDGLGLCTAAPTDPADRLDQPERVAPELLSLTEQPLSQDVNSCGVVVQKVEDHRQCGTGRPGPRGVALHLHDGCVLQLTDPFTGDAQSRADIRQSVRALDQPEAAGHDVSLTGVADFSDALGDQGADLAVPVQRLPHDRRLLRERLDDLR
ncbi:Uncharacterised protein [Mycobacteroides abscessus subsp. abscessus]|nr:Uncharacterised protein [Mycobacteroides abscessus subsp. abscessus]